MTEGIKGKQGFQSVIKQEDIITVLKNADKPLKNSTVLVELKNIDPKTYNEISIGGVKKVLLKMWKAGEISGGKDPEVGVYLWTVKKELTDKKEN